MGYTVTVDLPKMTKRMVRHYECLKATERLELEMFGAVLSDSIKPQLEAYRWWPMPGPPRVPASLQSPHRGYNYGGPVPDLPDPGMPQRW